MRRVMPTSLPILALACAMSTVVGAAWLGALHNRAASEMTKSAQAFLNALTPEQQQRALFRFDDPERLNWHYIPRPRRGLPLKDMTPKQREAAHALLHAALSTIGYRKAVAVMALEAVLHELEKGGRIPRDPELYYWSIFGTPSTKGRWGWRVEGHHLSLNFVIDDGRVVSATPMFYGANPAVIRNRVPGGPPIGTRTLAKEELLARELAQSLTEEQRQVAVVARKAPRDIRAGGSPQPPLTRPIGIPAAHLTQRQRDLLWRLITAYAENMPAEVRDSWLEQVKASGINRVHFAWAGGLAEGEPHYYRIQGPDFLIEYCNVQPDSAGNPANHIHSVWRSLHGDFGLPLTNNH